MNRFKNEKMVVYLVDLGEKYKKEIKCFNLDIFTEDALSQSDIPSNFFNCYYITYYNWDKKKWETLDKNNYFKFKVQKTKDISIKINFSQLLFSYAQYKIDEYQSMIEQSMNNQISASDESKTNDSSSSYTSREGDNQVVSVKKKKENENFILLGTHQFSFTFNKKTKTPLNSWVLKYNSNLKTQFLVESYDKKKYFHLKYKKNDENSLKLKIKKETLEKLEKGEYIQEYIMTAKDNNNVMVKSYPFSVKVTVT